MRPEEVAELIRMRPFVPLRFHLTDGRTHDVRHPDQVMVLRQRVDIGMPLDGTPGVMERVEHISLLHVVRIEPLPTPSSAGSNGAG